MLDADFGEGLYPYAVGRMGPGSSEGTAVLSLPIIVA
jgi:hypothetical protein